MVRAADVARTESEAATREWLAAQQGLGPAQQAVSAAQQKLNDATKALDALRTRKHLKPSEKKRLARAKHTLAAAQAALTSATTTLGEARARLGRATAKLPTAQSRALQAEQAANQAVRAESPVAPLPFAAVEGFDDLADAASLDGKTYTKLLGGPASVTPAEALKSDVGRVDLALRASPANAAKLIDAQLRNAAPAYRQQLLETLEPQLEAIADAASTDSDTASAYLQLMEDAPPALQDTLAKELAFNLGDDGAEVAKAITHRLEVAGSADTWSVAAKVLGALEKSGKAHAINDVSNALASRVHVLRADFEAKSSKTQQLSGELARLNYGFGPLTTDAQKTAAIDGFRKTHAKEYAATDLAASRLMTATAAFAGRPRVDPGDLKTAHALRDRSAGTKEVISAMWGGVIDNGPLALQLEAEGVARDLPAVQATQSGAYQLGQSMLEAINSKSQFWLDAVVSQVKDDKGLVEKSMDTVTKTLGQLAMSGKLGSANDAFFAVKKFSGLLGVRADQLDALQQAIFELSDLRELGGDTAAATEKMNKAFAKLDGAKFTKGVANNLKLFSLSLGIYGTVRTFQGFDQLSATKTVKALVDASRTGMDGVGFVANLMNKTEVVSALSKVSGGLGAVSGGLNVAVGIGELVDGKWGDGIGDTASGVGDLLLGASAVADSTGVMAPLGAALALGGLVAKHFFGSDPVGDAQRASQKDAKAYLLAAGLPAPMADALSHVREDDHRNIGTFLTQAAKAWNLSPQELMGKLASHPEVLERFVGLVLEMPVDEAWKYQAKQDYADQRDRPFQMWGPWSGVSPRSLETMHRWLQQQGVL